MSEISGSVGVLRMNSPASSSTCVVFAQHEHMSNEYVKVNAARPSTRVVTFRCLMISVLATLQTPNFNRLIPQIKLEISRSSTFAFFVNFALDVAA